MASQFPTHLLLCFPVLCKPVSVFRVFSCCLHCCQWNTVDFFTYDLSSGEVDWPDCQVNTREEGHDWNKRLYVQNKKHPQKQNAQPLKKKKKNKKNNKKTPNKPNKQKNPPKTEQNIFWLKDYNTEKYSISNDLHSCSIFHLELFRNITEISSFIPLKQLPFRWRWGKNRLERYWEEG